MKLIKELLNESSQKLDWNLENWDPVEYLKTLHTKQLMKLRDSCRIAGGKISPFMYKGEFIVTSEQIKAELDTREHVPNKIEARAARQRLAKEKKNR